MGLIIDCFAGGGGASVGIEMALGREVDIAINHDPEAIRMHQYNHPNTLHLIEDVWSTKNMKGRPVDLLWASPDCTSHSKAKGGQPRNKVRICHGLYKHAKRYCLPLSLWKMFEEIEQWGPLIKMENRLPSRKGEDYKKLITAIYYSPITRIQRTGSSRLWCSNYKETMVCHISKRWKGYCMAQTDT